MDQNRPTNGDDDWIFDPSLASMSRELRRELRQEAEEIEHVVAEAELRERTMADVAADAQNRGDFVGVATSRRTFNGYITYAGRDFISLRTDSFEVDINLADTAYVRIVQPGRRGGQGREEGPGTFEMRLVERKSPVERVEIGYRSLEETVIGTIVNVAQDHVELVDDHKLAWSIPNNSISWVIRRGRRPR